MAQVLTEHPATQGGLASVIGLLSLAERHATRTTDTELLRWRSVSGVDRAAYAPRYVFTTPPAEWDR